MNAEQKVYKKLQSREPIIVGILNLTPDSFSDGGKFSDAISAIDYGYELLKDGADIIDIGGESTGPGSVPVSSEEEISRISDVVVELSKAAFVSIDTYKARTAKHCLERGVRMINDVSALRAEPELKTVIKEFNAYVVLMYSKNSPLPHADLDEKDYEDVVSEIFTFLKSRTDDVLKSGIAREKIIVDPGLGRFVSHDDEYSWQILKELRRFTDLGYPIFIGASRKSFLGRELQDRDPVSQLSALLAYRNGAQLLRTHNVKMMKEFLDVSKKLNSN